MLHNSSRCAAKKDMLQSCASMRRHDDEIGRDCLRQPADFIEGRRATEHMAACRRDAAFTSYSLKLFERSLFSNLLVCHEGWGHEVRCVIRLTNMGEMDRSAKTPSQLLGDLDRLHRHFREVDWDDDVLNAQCFHAHSMKPLQLAGSALLAKNQPFFAKRHPKHDRSN